MKNYFKNESQCNCGCGADVHPETLKIANEVRNELGRPIVCNSGARCPERNAITPNASKVSAHLSRKGKAEGRAMDWRYSDGRDLWEKITALQKRGITRFGIYKTFFHWDNDPEAPKNVIWRG